MNECLPCGAPGGHPYCNDDCRAADLADDEEPNPPYDPPSGHTWLSWTT